MGPHPPDAKRGAAYAAYVAIGDGGLTAALALRRAGADTVIVV
jgi:hypothetical protein